MYRVVAGLCGAVLVLAGCSSNTDDQPPAPTPSMLTKWVPQQVCDLVDPATIKSSLGVDSTGGAGSKSGDLAYTCAYATGATKLATAVAATKPADEDQLLLDSVFADPTKPDGSPSDYQNVAGLGDLAGFGADADGHRLGVVFHVNDERLLITVSVHGKATVEQLQPLAAQMLGKLGVNEG